MSEPYKFADPKFIGTHSIITEDAVVTFKDPGSKFVSWRAFERMGMTVYKDKGAPYPPPELMEPVHDLDGLTAGMVLLVPHPLSNGYNRVTVTEVSGVDGSAEGDEVFVSLHFDEGLAGVFAPEWTAASIGCKKGLERIDFS